LCRAVVHLRVACGNPQRATNARDPNQLNSPRLPKKIFTYEEAVALWPEVQRITDVAVQRIDELEPEQATDYQHVVSEWADTLLGLGLEVKGLWLVDFDSGGGYYCWRHPEPALEYFHGYEEGFGGRVKLN
jgi:hypothetical protein